MKLYAEENSGEAAARRFSVYPKRARDWRINQTELQRLSEDSNRSCKMIRAMAKQMCATLSDSRDEEFAVSAGRLTCFLRRNKFTCRRRAIIAQKDARGLTEKLVKFVTCPSRIFERKELNACSK